MPRRKNRTHCYWRKQLICEIIDEACSHMMSLNALFEPNCENCDYFLERYPIYKKEQPCFRPCKSKPKKEEG